MQDALHRVELLVHERQGSLPRKVHCLFPDIFVHIGVQAIEVPIRILVLGSAGNLSGILVLEFGDLVLRGVQEVTPWPANFGGSLFSRLARTWPLARR